MFGSKKRDFVELAEIFEQCASDGHLSPADAQRVRTFVAERGIDRRDAERAMRNGCARVVRRDIQARIADRHWSDEDEQRVFALCKAVGLGTDVAKEIFAEEAQRVCQGIVDTALDDGLISDTELAEIRAMPDRMSVTFDGAAVWPKLEMANRAWRAAEGPLSPVDPGIKLKRGETAFYVGRASWREWRKERVSNVTYGGLRGSIRIARGLSFRYGNVGYSWPSRDVLRVIADGTLILTNTRLILVDEGRGSNKEIRWSDVLSVGVLGCDAFEVEKSRGKSPIIGIEDDSATRDFPAFLAARLHRTA